MGENKITIGALLDILEYSTKIYIFNQNDENIDSLYEGLVKEMEFQVYRNIRNRKVASLIPDKDELYIDLI